jgi:antitoxin (DNA-binding transcriptional repressor) of toxin-antitoxin stability system
MQIVTVGDFKANFSDILSNVKQGKKFTIAFGKKKEKVAVILPYKEITGAKRKLGILEKTASVNIHADFSISDEEMFAS